MFPFLKKEQDVKIRFMFSSKRMTWDDLNTVELLRDGQISSIRMMTLAARFMVDDKNEYLPTDKATKILGGLSQEDIADVLKKFTDAMLETAVPKANGNPSPLPLEAGQATDSLIGS